MKVETRNRKGEVTGVTIIDNEDIGKIGDYKLVLSGKKELRYAGFWTKENGKRKFYYLHRFIMNAPKGKDVDHKNHNTLDNRKRNLKVCSRAENIQNGSKHKDAKWSKVLGVTKGKREWIFIRMENGIKIRKSFRTKKEAEKYGKSIYKHRNKKAG